MTVVVLPNELQVLQCLRTFLLSVLPAGTEVIKGQINRVPEPASQDFVIFTPIGQSRLAFNTDNYVDSVFTGSISGTLLTITDIQFDEGSPLQVGSFIFGVGVANGTQIVEMLSGTGGLGTYKVSISQTIPSQPQAAGSQQTLIENDIKVQIDVHGPNSTNNAAIISNMLQDEAACESFATTLASLGYTGNDTILVQPLYCADPQQRPFLNENDQIEYRWSIDAHIQANQTIFGIPQQFAATLQPQMIEVDAAYPTSS
jgi:hypothetical protein